MDSVLLPLHRLQGSDSGHLAANVLPAEPSGWAQDSSLQIHSEAMSPKTLTSKFKKLELQKRGKGSGVHRILYVSASTRGTLDKNLN